MSAADSFAEIKARHLDLLIQPQRANKSLELQRLRVLNQLTAFQLELLGGDRQQPEASRLREQLHELAQTNLPADELLERVLRLLAPAAAALPADAVPRSA